MTYLRWTWIIGCEMPGASEEHGVNHQGKKKKKKKEEETTWLACGPPRWNW